MFIKQKFLRFYFSLNKLFKNNRIIIFLHIQKVGGSSLWHSIAASASRAQGFCVADAFHEHHVNKVGTSELDALAQIKRNWDLISEFNSRLFVHYHGSEGKILSILPEALVVVMYREPEARLRSAFRHWRGQFPVDDVLKFFESDESRGLDSYITECLTDTSSWNYRPSTDLFNSVYKRTFFISLEEYSRKTFYFRLLMRLTDLPALDPIHYEGTVTDKNINRELDSLIVSNDYFRDRWENLLSVNENWHRDFGL